MALPTTTSSPVVVQQVQGLSQQLKAFAQNALTSLQGAVDADFIFDFTSRFYNTGAMLNQYAGTPGLDGMATQVIPGYSGSMTADINATTAAGQNVINWIVTNFPKDAQGYAQAYTINANGSRSAAQFAPSATAGLRTLLQTFINTIN